jgi:hypothetical protein
MNADDVLLGENGEAVRWCHCAELVIKGKRVACPPHHDCAYVKQRNLFLPLAIEYAFSRSFREGESHSTRGARFTNALSTEMDRLCAPLLKQKNGAAPANA